MSGSKIYKFVIDGSNVTMFKLKDGVFVARELDHDQTLTYDATSGTVTLRETNEDHIEVKTFAPTLDTTDDPSLFVRIAESETTLDGTLIVKDDHDGDGSDDDVIRGGGYNDHHHGGRGDDHIGGRGGNDDLYGDDGNDVLSGGTGDDTVHGGNDDDEISGGKGNDHEYGDDGNDHIDGDDGTDEIHGGDGSDVISGGRGGDDVSGDDGNDQVSGNDGDDDLSGGGGDDVVNGGTGSDDVSGDDGNDNLSGGLGNDHVHGGAGNDKVVGGGGDDTLEGGSGKDFFTGGAGADTFTFDDGDFGGLTKKTADRISDFNHGQGDHIDLSSVDADTTTDGDQAFTFIGTGAFTGHAGELRYSVSSSRAMLSGDTNGDGVADFAVRLDHVSSLVAEDFVL